MKKTSGRVWRLKSRGRAVRRRSAAAVLWVTLVLALAAGAGEVPVVRNIGEHAPKFDGRAGVPVYPDQALELKMKIDRSWSIAAVGDLLEFQPFSTNTDPRIQFLVGLLRSADMTIGNYENSIMDFDKFGYYGLNLSPKEVADDWAHMGIRMVSRANNQDQRAPGIWENFRQIERVGIIHVGVGHSLPEARRARYVETTKGSVGLIGVYISGGVDTCCAGGTVVRVTAEQLSQVGKIKASILARRNEVEVPIALPPPDPPGEVNVFGVTFAAHAISATKRPPMFASESALGSPPRRPYDELTAESLGSPVDGVTNTLHVTLYHGVTIKQMAVLREIAHESGGGDLSAFGTHFRVMEMPGEHSFDMNQQDLTEILTQIKTAKEASDFLAVNVHWHQNRYDFQHYSYDHFPADFEIKFAHAAIEEGADLVVGEGVHTIKGVEIYKGKPIYYGVSNYMFQAGLMPTLGQGATSLASMAGASLPGTRAPDTAGHDEITGEHQMQGFYELRPNLEALLAWSHYEGGRLREVKIYPVDLGQTYRPTDQAGIPMKPSPAVADKILTEVSVYSKPFGTQIQNEDGVGVIKLP